MSSDIEKIRKINEMTQYLKQHGFAENSEEAVSKAEEVYNMASKISNSNVDQQDDKKELKPEDSMQGIELVKRSIEMLKSSTQSQIDSMKDDLHNVIQKMNEMIVTINELENLKSSVTTIDEGDEKQQRLAPKVLKKPEEEKQSSHPRSGEMEPGDIDLSSTFYYGNKR